MPRTALTALAVFGLVVAVAARTGLAGSAGAPDRPALQSAHAAATPAAAAPGPLITEYCLTCHDAGTAKGELVLEKFDPEHPEQNVVIAEKMIRKLRAGLMPPAGRERPDKATIQAFVTSLETRIDAAAALHPNPGFRPFQRLNRVEYEREIHELLSLDVDVEAFLPPDTVSAGFDNIADAQTFSPALMEGYMRAASRISQEALGDAHAAPGSSTYKVPRTSSQMNHVDGTPIGTRGGISVIHNFPADGEYVIKVALHAGPTGSLFGATAKGEQLEVSINGVRAALLDVDPRMSESNSNNMTIAAPPVAIKAGPQRISAAFIQRFTGLVDDLIQPIEHTLADTQIGTAQGITTLPHLRDLIILGPNKITGISDTPSRRKILVCRPASAADERPCATEIVTDLARAAYRRPVTSLEVSGLLTFYDSGRKTGDFESGIQLALQAVLASPSFVFRLEQVPATAKPGQTYRIADLDLASRLSFFLWETGPDAELLKAATNNTLHTPAVLEAQVHRMLADPRAETLSTRFAAQWFRLQDLEGMHPDALLYPHYDHTLGEAMRRETELFFDSIVREDHNVLDLLTANYTYLNDRLAQHYGIPGVSGPNFRRVELTDDTRRGLLGQGSILTLTSVADRTSPVQRGKWVMEVILGTPPPPPPPVVPQLEETKAARDGKLLSVRERLEEHRRNPTCNACHRMMDPIGLALENFDVTGAWRARDSGVLIDPTGQMYDGSPINGPASLRAALMNHSDMFLRTFTERLMTYGLGRRVEAFDMPTVRAILRDASARNNSFSAFVLGIVKSSAFQMSRVDDAPAVATKTGR